MTREHADQPGGALRDLVLQGPDHRPGGGAGVVGGDRTDLAAKPVALVAERSSWEFPASRNAAVSYPGHSDHMPLRCLLVDDNDVFLETASLLLEREGLTVVGMASSIAEALRQARALRPDLILVDIGLGDESGFTLARLLARDGQSGGAEVILISTGAEEDYEEMIDDSPVAGFLAKSELSSLGISRVLGHTP
jgi:CheY-like chemotaxis protein